MVVNAFKDLVQDILANETILSGNIANLDIDTDNVYHVVTGSGTNNTAVLDGFTVQGGYADEATGDHNKGGGLQKMICNDDKYLSQDEHGYKI